MQNWSSVFQETIDEFESPYVPGDQGDAGKGQVTVRAGYKIHSFNDQNIGYIAKNPGQTQFYGVAVDALLDQRDGSGADFLTDELQSDGRRLIKSVYVPYATPPAGTPITNWVQPSAEFLNYPGPLVLKSTPTPPPNGGGVKPPDPMPPMPTEWSDAEDYTIEWYADTNGALDAIYMNLLWRPVDMGGMNNWMFHVRENDWTVDEVVEEIKKSDEYKHVHGS